jgi:uncharacterized protein
MRIWHNETLLRSDYSCIVRNMSAPPGTAAVQIVGVRERLPDQLRGLALLGIVLVNMPFLALSSSGFAAANTPGIADRVTAFVVVAFAQGKFYLLFAFLFGYSLSLMLRGTGGGVARHYRRRLVGLAVLGVAHAVLFFVGDILLSYALLGTALIWFVRRGDRTALRGAAVAYTVGLVVLGAVVLVTALEPPPSAGFVDDTSALDAALRGSFLEAAAGRAAALPAVLVVLGVLNWSLVLSMFLLGLVAGRRGLLARPEEHGRLWRRLLLAGGLVGVPGGIGSAVLSATGDPGVVRYTAGVALGFATAPFLTAAYVAIAALRTRGPVLAFMEPAGRMSLTGYLGESILLSAVFCGWGLGLFGKLSALPAALIAIGVWLTLDLLAKAWLARHRHGPFEWLLRTWSRGRGPSAQRPASTSPDGDHGHTAAGDRDRRR